MSDSRSSEHEDVQDGSKELMPDAEPPSETPTVLDATPNYSIFTRWEKRGIVIGAALAAFFSPLTAQIYFPAINMLAEELHVSVAKINLTVTTYMIFQGITPMFIGNFADVTGRRPAFMICFIIYIAANIGCALAPNYTALLILRMAQSAGSSSTVSLCQAVVSDIITSAERGQYVGYAALPVMLAPSLGPVLGGLLSQYLGWRWIFWFLTILAGVVCLIYALFVPETCRNIVGDGSLRPHPLYRTLWQLIKDFIRARRAKRDHNALGLQPTRSRTSTRPSLHIKLPNPLRSLVILFEIEVFVLLMYSAVVFAGFYAMATAIPPTFAEVYGLDDLKIGLIYIPMGAGSIVAANLIGAMLNWNYRRHCKKLGIPFEKSKQQDLTEFPIEKARLEVGMPMLLLAMATTFSWGWALQYRAHLAVPLVLLFLQGLGMVGFNNTVSTLLVDINPRDAAAATASSNLTRCLVGAAATAAINPMISALGNGWAFTIFGFVLMVFMPSIFVIMKKGIMWRKAKEEKRLRHREGQ